MSISCTVNYVLIFLFEVLILESILGIQLSLSMGLGKSVINNQQFQLQDYLDNQHRCIPLTCVSYQTVGNQNEFLQKK